MSRALLAAKAREGCFENAARQEVLELARDELRQTGALARLGRSAQEGVEVGVDDLMEHGVLGVSRTIRGLGARHPSRYRASRAAPMSRDRYGEAGCAPRLRRHRKGAWSWSGGMRITAVART